MNNKELATLNSTIEDVMYVLYFHVSWIVVKGGGQQTCGIKS